ncbi:MAG: glycoside hydrolase family 6 protein [Myxococcales bacterium]|nr:glycoside hydrolase family 6 protein [Myxococcales bacterium]
MNRQRSLWFQLAASATSTAAVACSTGASPSGLPAPVAAQEIESAPSVAPAPAAGNPFAGATPYIDPRYVSNVEATAQKDGADAALLRKVAAFSTAVWLSSTRDVQTAGAALDAAGAHESRAGRPVVTVFVLYDLPGRDCAASASGGEMPLGSEGEARYRKAFVDPIAAAFRAHASQRIVALVEPDSLANLATNMALPRCAAAEGAYERSVAYAISTLAMPNVSVYLDAAHAGWLGWSRNREHMARVLSEVLAQAGGPDKIRGFVTNVSNYDALANGDLERLEPSDPAKGELAYIDLLAGSLAKVGIRGKNFVIDTSRNGRSGIRTRAGSWCNVKGAGLGERPRADPAPRVDAYFWVKPPGESDGSADPTVLGFDENCGPRSPDSTPGAPPAGAWFGDYFIALAKNAVPAL